MKKLSQILALGTLAALLLFTSGCVQDQPRRYGRGYVPRGPEIGSPDWITWVDHRVDTRYANGVRPDPGSQEWYAIVDHVVFADYSRDFHRSYERDQFNYPDRNYYPNDAYNDSDRREFTSRRYASSRHPADADYAGYDRSSSKNFRPLNTRNREYEGVRYFERCDPPPEPRRPCLGGMKWKRAVDARLKSGRIPAPPPRSDPWDAPLAPTH